MSALGQKQTYALQNTMSALPPIATAKADLRNGSCPLYPQERTCAVQYLMSAKGQKRTIAIQTSFDAIILTGYCSKMSQIVEPQDLKAVADDAIASLTSHRQIPTFSSRPCGLTLADAYRVLPLLRGAFEARGEKVVGRKIGFTNQKVQKVYGVQAPIWGYATDHTAHDLAHAKVQRVKDFTEPRIEPEIMFGLKAPPVAGMNEAELLDCIEWVSLGYEIVQSIYPDWKFTAADTVAANGVHGALLIGPRHAVASRKRDWQQELASFTVELHCNKKLSKRGGGVFVLGSPLLALRHLVELLTKDSINPPLSAGEIISTGTLTLAMPVNAGETWTTKVSGIPLEEITIQFE